jgi:hypothetical protein
MEQFKKDIINIDNERNLVRDKNSKAVLSRDLEGLQAYKIQKIHRQRILEYEKDINTLKEEISEIRTLITMISEKIINR